MSAAAGLFTVADGETYVVAAGELLILDEAVNFGTLRNEGSVEAFGVYRNFGLTDNVGMFSNSGEFRNQSVLANSGDFSNTGLFLNILGGLVRNTGTFANATDGQLDVIGDARLVNDGLLRNDGEMTVTGQLENNGELRNDGSLTISASGVPGGGLSGNGNLVNERAMSVAQETLVIAGNWLNNSQMSVIADAMHIEASLRNRQALTVTGQLEVTASGTLEQAGSFTDIDGVLVNRGTTDIQAGTILADEVENHATVQIGSQLGVDSYVQYAGNTELDSANLITPSVQIHGGLLATGNGVGIIDALGTDTLVEVLGGIISAGTARLAIEGGLVLYPDATMAATLESGPAGTDTGTISVSTDLVLAGTLDVDIGPGASVVAGDDLLIAWAATITGMFETLLLPDVAGLGWEVLVRDIGPPGIGFQELRLVAVEAVPVPLPLLLLVSALGLLGPLSRRTARYPRGA